MTGNLADRMRLMEVDHQRGRCNTGDDNMVMIPKEVLPDGWHEEPHINGLICPCGSSIELDGECPNGHVSPLVKKGLI